MTLNYVDRFYINFNTFSVLPIFLKFSNVLRFFSLDDLVCVRLTELWKGHREMHGRMRYDMQPTATKVPGRTATTQTGAVRNGD